jgi:hypothetical protein
MVMKRPMVAFLAQLLLAIRSRFTRRVRLEAENLLLRQQLVVLRRKSPARVRLWNNQIVRIILDEPRPLRRVRLEFSETEIERTQEFTLRWSAESGGPSRDVVRSNGVSARMARRTKSKIIRSIWIASPSWNWLLSPILRRTMRSRLWPSGAWYNGGLALQHSDHRLDLRFALQRRCACISLLDCLRLRRDVA